MFWGGSAEVLAPAESKQTSRLLNLDSLELTAAAAPQECDCSELFTPGAAEPGLSETPCLTQRLAFSPRPGSFSPLLLMTTSCAAEPDPANQRQDRRELLKSLLSPERTWRRVFPFRQTLKDLSEGAGLRRFLGSGSGLRSWPCAVLSKIQKQLCVSGKHLKVKM